MKNQKLLLLLLLSANILFCSDGGSGGASKDAPVAEQMYSWNMDQWIAQCRQLSTTRTKDDGCRDEEPLTTKDSAFGEDQDAAWGAFSKPLEDFLKLMVDQLRVGSWLGNTPVCAQGQMEINLETEFAFAPFAQRLDLPDGAEVVFHGDFHGDCHSFMNELESLRVGGYLDENFRIIKENVCMVFLGDYVDRGLHGAEVMYTLFRLKLANPGNVFMVRGNHEDYGIALKYGFGAECDMKFGGDDKLGTIAKLYEIMPVVLYVGCGNNYLQCCHGGMEPGYNPSNLLNSDDDLELLGELKRTAFVRRDKGGYEDGDVRSSDCFYDFSLNVPTFDGEHAASSLGFMWHDFMEDNFSNMVSLARFGPSGIGQCMAFSQGATNELLQLQNRGAGKVVRGVFRAHQHSAELNPMMAGLIKSRGVYKLWNVPEETEKERRLSDGLVWTFNVAPDVYYGLGCGFDFDAYAFLTVADDYDDWTLRVVNTQLDGFKGSHDRRAVDRATVQVPEDNFLEDCSGYEYQAVVEAPADPVAELDEVVVAENSVDDAEVLPESTRAVIASRVLEVASSAEAQPHEQEQEGPIVRPTYTQQARMLVVWFLTRPRAFLMWLFSWFRG